MPDSTTLDFLHQRYQQQASWTAAIRAHLSTRWNLKPSARVLEVGCGTGVIIEEVAQNSDTRQWVGIDLDGSALRVARQHSTMVDYAQADALLLPFPTNTFDLIVCHFFLLWAKPLHPILQEIVRVLKPQAPFAAFAEPDYGGRIDYPPELSQLGHWQETALQQQGASTRIGRELLHLFQQANLKNVSVGVLGGEWQADALPDDETSTLLHDLQNTPGIDPAHLKTLLQVDQSAHEAGTRLLFVPTFYAVGHKTSPCKNGGSAL